MKDMTITGNAIENLLDSYVDHKVMMKTYEDEVAFDECRVRLHKLENNAEYMYHRGCCETAESWIRCIGISPSSPIIEKMIKDHME